MQPDDLQRAWQSQPTPSRVTIDAESLLKEVQRNERQFTAMIFWRDVREVGVALVLIPVWIFLGIRTSVPWTWWLTVPVLVWVAGFMLVHRMRSRRQQPEAGESLLGRVEMSLAQVNHQIWLLKNVHWWGLAPLTISMLAFLGHCIWLDGWLGWPMAFVAAGMVAVVLFVIAAIYWLNQMAVRTELEPRKKELEGLLRSLQGEEK